MSGTNTDTTSSDTGVGETVADKTVADETVASEHTLTCPACAAPVEPRQRFCEECGENLTGRRTTRGGPVNNLDGGPACVGCGGVSFSADNYCDDCGRSRPSPRDRMESDFGLVAGISDRGRRRARNEDSMAFGYVGTAESARAIVAVVCDGVGSSERADEASQAASDAALEVLLTAVQDAPRSAEFTPEQAEAATVDAVHASFDAVNALVRPNEAPSCTLVSAVVTPETVTIGWLGDSRAYWLGTDSEPFQLTADDTVVALLMANGLSHERAMADPNAHALARWVGPDTGDHDPHLRTFRPSGPGVVLLCSDGLWNYRPEPEALLACLNDDVRPLSPAADTLVTYALEAGGHDNITVVLVPFGGVEVE